MPEWGSRRMRVEIINKEGKAWKFNSIKKALPHIKREMQQNYQVINNVRVYDDRGHL